MDRWVQRMEFGFDMRRVLCTSKYIEVLRVLLYAFWSPACTHWNERGRIIKFQEDSLHHHIPMLNQGCGAVHSAHKKENLRVHRNFTLIE
jgi:hypothetical protein